MRIVRWGVGAVLAVAVVVFMLDMLGGYVLDGPLGPIPGGVFRSGAVNPEQNPDWSNLEKVVELEIRPAKPWSLSIWNAVIDGNLYVPSAMGARRRWPAAALQDPRVRLRTRGQIYELRLERVTDPALQERIGKALVKRYDLDPPESQQESTTWYFHLAPRTQAPEGQRQEAP